ncbi:hypothetical protein [Alicyclobacillus fodiniaquatilis]|uniref:S1 motif domain-containing protein n=1 Tax=Alicyclobacillus fodiniaquatilis TaxID=1661150 RepID=A0ABW4JJS8_9BACL
MNNTIYVNISAEGALLNPEKLEDREQCFATFFQFRTNRTVFQAKAVGIENISYHVNQNGEQLHKREDAIVVEYGPFHGYVPISESGYRAASAFVGVLDKYISLVPEHYVPVDGREIFIFSRTKAVDLMKRANDGKLTNGTDWTAVVRRESEQGYLVNVGGFPAWLPNALVDWTIKDGKAPKLNVGDTIDVKIRDRNRRRMIVSRRDALGNPFDSNRQKYNPRGRYLAEIVSINALNVYGRFNDGTTVLMRRNAGRDVLRVGAQVLCRLTGVNDERKLFEGAIERIV